MPSNSYSIFKICLDIEDREARIDSRTDFIFQESFLYFYIRIESQSVENQNKEIQNASLYFRIWCEKMGYGKISMRQLYGIRYEFDRPIYFFIYLNALRY